MQIFSESCKNEIIVMNVVGFWYNNARPKALPQSMLPALLAVCMAAGSPDFSLPLSVLAIAGVLFGHLGMNLFDDYFDYRKKGTEFRDKMAGEGIRARIAKCSYITSGTASLSQLKVACLVFSFVALGLGSVIFLFRGEYIAWIALATAVLGISYSGAPLRLSYHGWGELEVGFIFGPLLMTGVYYSAAGTITPALLFVSFPVGLLVSNILYTHSIMDYEPDKKVGKMTLAVLLRDKKKMLVALFFLLFCPFAVLAWGIVRGELPVYYWAVFLTLPMALSLFRLMVWFVGDPHRVFTPKFWMGPMTNWENIQKTGIDWFMIRWLLARNLLSFFCLIILIISLVTLYK